jgi:replication protein
VSVSWSDLPLSDGVSGVSLGTITNYAATRSNPDVVAGKQRSRLSRLSRWALQSEARSLLRHERRLGVCFRSIVPGRSGVDVFVSPLSAVSGAQGVEKRALYSMPFFRNDRSTLDYSAHYGSLMRCGSVWLCPVCASIISERRRRELELAVSNAEAAGAVVYLETLTVQHSKRDNLATLLDAFLSAVRATTGNRPGRELRRSVGFIGSIRALEVTHGGSGWHPHCHRLVFLPREADAAVYASNMRYVWARSARHFGLEMNEHGYDLRPTAGAVADYVAKWGHDPAYELPWGASAEMSKAHIKAGRLGALTPFGLLRASFDGDNEAGALFCEFAKWFKGRRQLQYSDGLRSLLGLDVELTDAELVERSEVNEWLLGNLTVEQWRSVRSNDGRGELLEVARSGSWSAVLRFVELLAG